MAIEITGRINFDSSSVDDAVKSVESLKNEVKETEQVSQDFSENLASSFDNVKNASDVLGGSVASLVGGLALLGIENDYIKNLEQGALGAIAFASGIKQLGDGLVGFSKNTKVATVAQRAFNIVANANPYILAATALVGVTAAFIGLSQAFKQSALDAALANQSASELSDTLIESSNAVKELNLSTEDTVKIFQQATEESQKQLDTINASEQILIAQGKTEREILNLKIAQTDEVIENSKRAIDALRQQKVEEIEKTERFANATRVILQFLTLPVQLLLGAVDGIIDGLGAVGILSEETVANVGSLRDQFNDFGTGLIFDPEDTAEEFDLLIQESEDSLLTLENQRAGYQNRITQIDKDARNKRLEEEKKAIEEERKLREQQLQEIIKNNQDIADQTAELLNQIETLENDFLNSKLSREEQELNAVREKYFNIIEAARQAGEDVTILEEGLQTELQGIRDKFEQERVLTQVELEESVNQARVDLARDGLNAVGELLNGFASNNENAQRRVFNAQKALAIADTTISTYTAAQQAYRSQLTIPTPDAPIRATIAAGIAIAQGLARVAVISRTQFNPNGGGSSSGGSSSPGISAGLNGTQPSVPNFQLFGTGGTTIGGPGAPQNQVEPTTNLIRAFVSETDLTNTNRRLDLIRNGSELN